MTGVEAHPPATALRALVTGATGCIGQAVVAHLLSAGHDVAIVTRRPFLAEQLFGSTVTIHEWHPYSEPVPTAAIADREAVLHLMGAPLAGAPSSEREALAVSSRVTTTRRIGEALGDRRFRLVVASLSLAPTGAAEQPTEASAHGAPATEIERAILTWEQAAHELAERGASVAIVRLGLVAGLGGPIAELTRLARLGIVPNLRGAVIPAIALSDAAEMLAGLLLHREIEGVVHGFAPEAVEGAALEASLARLSPVPFRPVLPLSMLRRRLGLATALLSSNRQVLPKALTEAGANFSAPDPTESVNEAIRQLAGRGGFGSLHRAPTTTAYDANTETA
ncbi:MAG: NAD-dependent epimerase/dehydratase family protein [Hyphomicrobiaceae bacterium]